MPPKLKDFLLRWLINTVAVAVASSIVSRIHYQRGLDLLLASLLLGILNAFARPLLMLVSLPLVILTLGLFTFVINGLLLYWVGLLLRPHFQVETFGAAFWGALIITIMTLFLNALTGTGKSRVYFRRGSPPPSRRDDDGSGPVIDV
jgi:putative membrane protein